MVWLLCFLCAHHFRRVAPRGLLPFSILGVSVVVMGWFWPNLLPRLHEYGRLNHLWLLPAMVVANLLVFLVGLAPAGWLRLHKA